MKYSPSLVLQFNERDYEFDQNDPYKYIISQKNEYKLTDVYPVLFFMRKIVDCKVAIVKD